MTTEVGPGSVVRMTTFKAISGAKVKGQDWAEFTFAAPKGRRFVMLLIGSEPADGSDPITADEVLVGLGWTPPPAPDPPPERRFTGPGDLERSGYIEAPCEGDQR